MTIFGKFNIFFCSCTPQSYRGKEEHTQTRKIQVLQARSSAVVMGHLFVNDWHESNASAKIVVFLLPIPKQGAFWKWYGTLGWQFSAQERCGTTYWSIRIPVSLPCTIKLEFPTALYIEIRHKRTNLLLLSTNSGLRLIRNWLLVGIAFDLFGFWMMKSFFAWPLVAQNVFQFLSQKNRVSKKSSFELPRRHWTKKNTIF